MCVTSPLLLESYTGLGRKGQHGKALGCLCEDTEKALVMWVEKSMRLRAMETEGWGVHGRGAGSEVTTPESTHHSPLQSWRGWALVWQPCHSLPPVNNRWTKGKTGPTRGDRREGECCVWTRMCMTQLCYWKCKVHRAACCKCELGLGPS